MSKINVQAALEGAQLLTETLAALEARKGELAEKRNKLAARNGKLYDMPLHRDEAKALVVGSIDGLAKQFPSLAGWHKIFGMYAQPQGERYPQTGRPSDAAPERHSGPLSLADLVDCERHRNANQVPLRRILGPNAPSFFMGMPSDSPLLEESRAAFFFGDIIKARVERYFDMMFPTVAQGFGADSKLTIAERKAEIAVNDSAIAELDEELFAVESHIEQVKAATPKERLPRFSSSLDGLRAL